MAAGGTKGPLVARLSPNAQSQVQVEDGYLIALAKQGDPTSYDRLVRRYYGFVRLKASSYFLAGGDSDDLIQEGLVGLYKAIRDFRSDRESSFRNFAELCITRQIITAVKTATRNKHTPLNQYVSFSSTPASASDGEPTLDEVIPGPSVHDPVNQVISSEELRSLVACLSTALLATSSRACSRSTSTATPTSRSGERIGCDCKTVDNALQRVKRKVGAHLAHAQRDAVIGARERHRHHHPRRRPAAGPTVVGGLVATPAAPARGEDELLAARARGRPGPGRWPAPWTAAGSASVHGGRGARGLRRALARRDRASCCSLQVVDRPGTEEDQALFRVVTDVGSEEIAARARRRRRLDAPPSRCRPLSRRSSPGPDGSAWAAWPR